MPVSAYSSSTLSAARPILLGTRYPKVASNLLSLNKGQAPTATFHGSSPRYYVQTNDFSTGLGTKWVTVSGSVAIYV